MMVVKFGTIRSRPKDPIPIRLKAIHDELCQVLDQVKPDLVAMESVFVARNPESALKLGQARGVCLLSAAKAGVEVVEYAPAEIKSAVCGHGRAVKLQVMRMIGMILNIKEKIPEDAADALAVAICHLQGSRYSERLKEVRR